MFLLGVITSAMAQLKVVQNGNVAIGINYPNHSLHVWGYSQVFNYNLKEIQFRPYDQSGNLFHSTIGSNLGRIVFWHGAWGYNTLTRGQCVSGSDVRMKRDITPLNNSLSIIKNLQPKRFKYVDTIIPGGKYNYGFIAQEVIQHIPELVDTSGKYGYLTLNYEGIIPFLVGAVQEQSAIIDSLLQVLSNNSRTSQSSNSSDSMNKQIKDLKKEIEHIKNNCCQSTTNTNSIVTNEKDVNISSVIHQGNDDLLLQNVPNPFDNTTVIKFNIPEKHEGKFFIKVYTLSGEERMSFQVNKSERQLVITAGNLASGMYLYALIANNDVLKVKQMVISK